MTPTPQNYFDAGLSILPCDPVNKKPRIRSWKQLTKKADPSIEFAEGDSIAIICGAVSGNLEVIDFDLKYDITGSLYRNFIDMVNAHDDQLLALLVIQKTQNGGYHFFYKCDTIGGNTKLASRPATIEEGRIGEKVKVLIETRGEGGYVLAYPSEGYSMEQGDLTDIPTITEHQRELLLSCAKSFNEVLEPFKPEKPIKVDQTGLTSFDDYNQRGDCVSLLQKHGWTVVRSQRNKIFLRRPGNTSSETSGNFDIERNQFSVFSTSTEFVPERAYLPYAVYAVLEHGGDFTSAASELYKQGYGEHTPLTAVRPESYISRFWSSYTSNKGKPVIEFSYQLYKEWLQQEGYFRYCYSENQYMFVLVKNNIVKQVYKKDIRKTVFDYILSLDLSSEAASADDVFEYLAKNESKIFSDGILEIIDEKPIQFCEDTRHSAYFFFKSGVVVITPDGVNKLQYSELKGFVWNTQIIDFDIDISGDDDNDYKTFVRNITAHDTKRFNSVCSVIGFLIHGYKDFAKCPAIILNDEIISDDPEGGTGKGLFISGIKQFKKTHIIDGKNFHMNKSFAFQSVDLDTKLIAFEDVNKNFNFEKLFSIITEGITVEKKNKQEFFIPFAQAPKIIITTNYTVPGSGNSHDRRRFELEFRQHYNKENTPLREFGRLLFHDWNKDDWGRFYRFMFYCVQLYLTKGIMQAEAVNLPLKHLQVETAPEFVAYASGLKQGKRYDKKECYEGFIQLYPDFTKIKQRTFTIWLNKYAKYVQEDLIETKSNTNFYFSIGTPPVEDVISEPDSEFPF